MSSGERDRPDVGHGIPKDVGLAADVLVARDSARCEELLLVPSRAMRYCLIPQHTANAVSFGQVSLDGNRHRTNVGHSIKEDVVPHLFDDSWKELLQVSSWAMQRKLMNECMD